MIGIALQLRITVSDIALLIFVATVMYGLFKWAKARFIR